MEENNPIVSNLASASGEKKPPRLLAWMFASLFVALVAEMLTPAMARTSWHIKPFDELILLEMSLTSWIGASLLGILWVIKKAWKKNLLKSHWSLCKLLVAILLLSVIIIQGMEIKRLTRGIQVLKECFFEASRMASEREEELKSLGEFPR